MSRSVGVGRRLITAAERFVRYQPFGRQKTLRNLNGRLGTTLAVKSSFPDPDPQKENGPLPGSESRKTARWSVS